MVILSGQVASNMVGTDAFQETDMGRYPSRPIVKHSFHDQRPREIPKVIRRLSISPRAGRPGPCRRWITQGNMDQPGREGSEYSYPKKVKRLRPKSPPSAHSGQNSAKRWTCWLEAEGGRLSTPAVASFFGRCCSATEPELARELGVPVNPITLMGPGCLPGH